jgi:hypothetical protein
VIAIEYHADLKQVQSDARLARLVSPEMPHAPFDGLAWALAEHCGLEPWRAMATRRRCCR